MAFIDPGDSSSDMYRAVALRTVRELGDDEVTPLARSSASALRVNRRNESQSVWRKAEPLARPKKKQRARSSERDARTRTRPSETKETSAAQSFYCNRLASGASRGSKGAGMRVSEIRLALFGTGKGATKQHNSLTTKHSHEACDDDDGADDDDAASFPEQASRRPAASK